VSNKRRREHRRNQLAVDVYAVVERKEPFAVLHGTHIFAHEHENGDRLFDAQVIELCDGSLLTQLLIFLCVLLGKRQSDLRVEEILRLASCI